MDLSFLPSWPPSWPPVVVVALLALIAAAVGEAVVRWMRLPRLLGYLAAGALFSAAGFLLQVLQVERPTPTLQFSMDFAAAVILFDVGQRVSFGWVRRNPALLGASLLESLLSFVGVFAAMRWFGLAPLPSALLAAIAMSTSPAVVLGVTRDLRSQGQITERTLLLTTLNSIYAVVVSTLLLAWAHVETRGVLDAYLLQPTYLIAGSLMLAALGARVFLWVLRFVSRDRAAQVLVMLAVVLVVFATANALRLSPLLTLLACGGFVRAFDSQRILATTDFGLATGIAMTLFFALSAAVVDEAALVASLGPAAALVIARSVCKIVATSSMARWTGVTIRKGALTGLGLLPMSALALMLNQPVSQLNPQLGAQINSVLIASVLALQIIGALSLMWALRAGGESRETP